MPQRRAPLPPMLLCAALLVMAAGVRAAEVEPFPALPPLERFAPDVESGAQNNGVA